MVFVGYVNVSSHIEKELNGGKLNLFYIKSYVVTYYREGHLSEK